MSRSPKLVQKSTPKRPSIEARCAAALTLVGVIIVIAGALVVALATWSTERSGQRRELAALARMGAGQLADATPGDFDRKTDNHRGRAGERSSVIGRMTQWATSVLSMNDVLGVAVWDEDQKLLRVLPENQPHPAFSRWPVDGVVKATIEGDVVDTAVVAVDPGPRRSPRVFVGVWRHPPRVAGAVMTRVGIGAIVLGGLVGITLWLVCRRMDRIALAPMRVLAEDTYGEAYCKLCHRLAKRRDSIGQIARRLRDLSNALEDEQLRVKRTEASMDEAVRKETRKMSAQLKKLKNEAARDALTGLANRRFIEESLADVFADIRSRNEQASIVMIDVDNFKPLNDDEGHAAGDDILRFLGELLGGSLRETDVAARYGGDEFVLVLSNASTDQANVIASRIIRMFAQRVAMMPISTPVTLSAGIANSSDLGIEDVFELLRLADEALYRSKRRGKNLVQIAG